MLDMRLPSVAPWLIGLHSLAMSAALPGCSPRSPGNSPDAAAPPPDAAVLRCDDSMKTAFKPDDNTTVLLVHAFKQGDLLALGATTGPTPPTAMADVCFVKLNVGPGHSGPVDAPSTSSGIGIEIWLPTPVNWNMRIHNLGGGGWAGGNQSSITQIGNPVGGVVASGEGSAVGTTDTGHTLSNGSF